jgi:hypothetical protein
LTDRQVSGLRPFELAVRESVRGPSGLSGTGELFDHRDLDLGTVAQVGMAIGVAEPLAAELHLASFSQGREPVPGRLELLGLRTARIALSGLVQSAELVEVPDGR